MTIVAAQPATRKSTIVRARQRLLLAGYHRAFGVLERIAPDLGAAWATRLWLTPPRSSSARRDDRPYPGVLARHPLPAGHAIAVESWGPEHRPLVYLVHGWGGWRGQLAAFVEPLLRAGFRVIAFDAPSHGESDPGRLGPGKSMLPEFTDALETVVWTYGPASGVVAHSMGGSAVALAVREGFRPKRTVFVAPSADPVGRVDDFAVTLGFGERISARLIARLERVGGRPAADYEATRVPDEAEVPATLVVHDRDDKEVAVEEGVRLAETWPGAELVQIGVSNFQVAHLERLRAETDVLPALNQIELHPNLVQGELRRYHAEHGIATEAWSPLASGGDVLHDQTVGRIAESHGRTTAQVILRWHLQLGNIVIPKSVTPARIAENFAIFDFELTDDQMAAITALDTGTRTGPNPDTLG